jgi:hypothetical protein
MNLVLNYHWLNIIRIEKRWRERKRRDRDEMGSSIYNTIVGA